MSPTTTLLDYLRSKGSHIDCDTLDSTLAAPLAPFTDCTSNQAIVWGELEANREKHEELVVRGCRFAVEEVERYRRLTRPMALELTVEEFAVEVITVLLAHKMAPLLLPPPQTGGSSHIHIQLHPHHSTSTNSTLSTSHRLSLLYHALCPTQPPPTSYPTLSIKLPASHASLTAAKTLESPQGGYNIRTLATMTLSLPQVWLAAEAGCGYVAVYVNDLGVHFPAEEEMLVRRKGGRDGWREEDARLGMELVRRGQKKLRRLDMLGTRMMAASLTSITECLQLAGTEHITIPTALLHTLANTQWSNDSTTTSNPIPDSVILNTPPNIPTTELDSSNTYLDNPAAFEKAFEESGKKRDYDEAMRIFLGFQRRLEGLVGDVMRREGLRG